MQSADMVVSVEMTLDLTDSPMMALITKFKVGINTWPSLSSEILHVLNSILGTNHNILFANLVWTLDIQWSVGNSRQSFSLETLQESS